MTILITRPLAAAKRTEQAFQSAGFETWIDPVLTIEQLPAQIDPIAYDAVITTSANGVESFSALTKHRDTPIFCAGAASAAIAQELGFASVFCPKATGGKELITLIEQVFNLKSDLYPAPNSLFLSVSPFCVSSPPPTFVSSPGLTRGSKQQNNHLDARITSGHDTVDNAKRFAYIRGEVVKVDMAKALRETGAHVDTYITYKTAPTSAWTDETVDLFHNGKITAITFYSEHSAHVTLDLLRTHDLLGYTPSITALCLSDAIADVLTDFVWLEIDISSP